MAVMTFTRRQVVDMLPEYLTKRGTPLTAMADAYAGELGVPRMALVALFNGWLMRDGVVFRRERAMFRSPYPTKWSALDEHWTALTAAGLAEPVDGGWRITPGGDAAVLEYQRRFREGLRALSVPADATRRAAADLQRLASRIPPAAARASWVRRRPLPAPDEPPSDLVALDLADLPLWYFRDDCHIGAWQERGYEGPAFDVLSYVWSSPPDVSYTKIGGHRTVDDLAQALAARQDRADVERNVGALVERGDLVRDADNVSITPQGQRTRDEIEAETDRRYFAIWDLDDAATARLGDDLRSIIDALPTRPS